MAYTDYENVAAPYYWDEAKSGFHYGGLSSDDRYGSVSALAGSRDVPLAARWGTGSYNAGESWEYNRGVFVLPTALEISEIFIDFEADYSTPGIALWYGTGLSMAGTADDPGTWYPELVAELGGPRQVCQFLFPSPLVVGAISFGGYREYPQGTPRIIHGIYGPLLEGAPPKPPQFWREFSNTYELR